MSTPSDREKITDKLTKEWEKIDDATLIKDVATKGKYLNLLLNFLSKRNQKSIVDTKHYFNSEIDKYVHRLLLNQQVHKAELVLINTNRNAKPIFYEFLMYPTTIDEDIKEHIIDHLHRNNDTFDQERDEFDYYLNVLQLAASNKLLKRLFEREIETFTLEALFQKDIEFRQKMAVTTCLQCRNVMLVDKLDRISTWKYLWSAEQYHYLSKWLELIYINRTGDTNNEIELFKKEFCFDALLSNLFSSWEIDDAMFSEVISFPKTKLNEFLINSFTKNGWIFDIERDDIIKLLQRSFSTLSFNANRLELLNDTNFSKILKTILKNGDLYLLIERIFSIKPIENNLKELNQHFANELILCKTFKNISIDDRQIIANIVNAVSNYIIRNSDPDFYSKMPSILLCEQLISDVDIRELSESDAAKHILTKISFIDIFFHRLHTNTYSDYTCTLNDLLRLKNTDITLIKKETIEEITFVAFTNNSLSTKYGLAISLNYVDYIRLRRCSHAVYKYFIDQLINYSQISNAQIQIACGNVCELALNYYNEYELICCCVAFIEMLGINSHILRAHINCILMIDEKPCNIIDQKYLNLLQIEEVIERTEKILLDRVSNSPKSIYDANEFYALRTLCQTRQHSTDLPLSFLTEISKVSNWFHFLLFAAFQNYSIRSIINACQMDCFYNKDIGLNIGRALKEIIIDEEMPISKRTATFSYREHKRKLQNRIDTNFLLSANHKAMSTSLCIMEQLPETKLNSSQYLNIRDDTDLFAIILMCTSQNHDTILSVPLIRELCLCTDVPHLNTYLNLIHFAFKLQWPTLTIIAASINDGLIKIYCWMTWLMIFTESTIILNQTDSLKEMIKFLILYIVRNRHTKSLNQSLEIFYPECKFNFLCKFLAETNSLHFTTDVTGLLDDYLLQFKECHVDILDLEFTQDEINDFTINILIEHVKVFSESIEYTQLLLECICSTGIEERIQSMIDFSTLSKINSIIQLTKVRVNIDKLIRNEIAEDDEVIARTNDEQNEYNRIRDKLIEQNEFDCAIQVADLLDLTKDSIVFKQWINKYEKEKTLFNIKECEYDLQTYKLSPIILINFLTFIADRYNYCDKEKYDLLKSILEIISKYQLNSIEIYEWDKFEFDLIRCVISNIESIDDIDMHNSNHFKEMQLRVYPVLFESFVELKNISRINDLHIMIDYEMNAENIQRFEQLMTRLLDQGDIVQALRLQAMFNYCTIDLHYIVFCMALAEGLTSILDLSVEQKQMLNEGIKTAASKFNRRTLRLMRKSSSCSSSPDPNSFLDSIEFNSRIDFEELPSGEKQHILDSIQSVASRVNHGFQIAQRVAMVYRAALHSGSEYIAILHTRDPIKLLQNASNENCSNRLLVMSDIFTSIRMSDIEIADFMAEQISRSIIKSRFYTMQSSLLNTFGQYTLWGYNLNKEFHLFLDLCPNTSQLGYCLLKYCDVMKIYRRFDTTKNIEPDLPDYLSVIFYNLRSIMVNQVLSYKKQNTINIELLIRAHDCFVHECSMEGIAFVLQRCKSLTMTLAKAKSWQLIVNLLMGIGRYTDMYYCFEILIKNDQFESLLGQFECDQVNGLREAIISYLHIHHPDDHEKYRLTALHFQMFKELAHLAEYEAQTIINRLLTQHEITSSAYERTYNDPNINSSVCCNEIYKLKCNRLVSDGLINAMESYAHAAENYLLENRLGLAQRTASNAELIAMQIDLTREAILANKIECICVLNIRNENVFKYLINEELNVPQALILSRAYPYEILWTEAIFNHHILNGRYQYIQDYCARKELTDDMVENILKNYIQLKDKITTQSENAMSNIIEMVQNITQRYKLASLFSGKKIVESLINSECLHYLKDTHYGRIDRV